MSIAARRLMKANGTEKVFSPAFYVSPSGSDSNPGTMSQPFATLTKAQGVMRGSTIKTAYLRAGVYSVTQMLTLTSADNNETWMTYPGDAVNSAILDASGMTFSNCGNNNVILIQGGNNITIDSLQIRNFTNGGGVTVHGGPAYPDVQHDGCYSYAATGAAHSNKVTNNIIHDSGIGADNIYPWGWFCGITIWGDVQNSVVTNNVVYNMGGMGISFSLLQMGPSGGLNNSIMSNNVIYNTNTDSGSGDLAAIYAVDRTAGSSTGVQIKNNFIRDSGNPAKSIKGIYLDDNASNISVTGNIVTGNATYGVQYHSGHNNHLTGNIFDLGTSGSEYLALYQNQSAAGSMTGNTFTNNIVIGGFSGSGTTGDIFYSGYGNSFAYPTVRDNVYWNYSGGSIPTSGDISDTNPVHVDPEISCWNYHVASGSPVYGSPVSFAPIAGDWGPPGYQIPQTGTPPSSPHTAPCMDN